jgi:dTMP kinase
MHSAVCGTLEPDLTVLLLPPLEAALRRARKRNARHVQTAGTDENRFEREPDEFYRRIHTKYCEIAAREPERVAVIADDAPIEAIQARVGVLVAERLAERLATTPAQV